MNVLDSGMLVALMIVTMTMTANSANGDTRLLAHWPLAGDCEDRSGNGHHGHNHGADLAAQGPSGKPGEAAGFDGRGDYVEVAPRPSLRLGTREFSIAAWVRTDEILDDVLGDIVSMYDPVRRKGFNLSIKIHAGVASTQANYRNLEFGIDDAKIDPAWTDRGRPGNNVFVCALAAHDGHLYAGTFETGADETGHVYRYAGGTEWTDCGSPDASNSVFCLAVNKGRLYAGTARYRASGSALPDSPNKEPGGRVYRYEGGKKWADCGRLGDANEVFAMTVYRGKLHAIAMYTPGVYEHDGGTSWKNIGTPGGQRCMTLAVFNGGLYSTGNGSAGVWRYDGDARWIDCGQQAKETQTYSVVIHEGSMYTGTWPTGSLFKYEGETRWISVGQLGSENEVMGSVVYNGKVYAGTLPLAQVYRFDGPGKWALTGQLDKTPDVRYRRAWSMAVFGGKLYCGTLPSGRVFSIEAGKCVTHDRELPPGWRHVAAVRDRTKLKLYVDGELAAESSTFKPADFDLSAEVPLRIGFGPHDYFNGSIKDVRIYDGPLGPKDIAALARGGE